MVVVRKKEWVGFISVKDRIGIKSEEMLREEQKEVNKEGSGKEVIFTSI